VQGRSRNFTLGATEAERRRRENRGTEGAEKGKDWEGVCPPQPPKGSGESPKLTQRDPEPSLGRKRIFGILEAHTILLVERTVWLYVPTKLVFAVKNPLSRRLEGHGLLILSGYSPGVVCECLSHFWVPDLPYNFDGYPGIRGLVGKTQEAHQ